MSAGNGDDAIEIVQTRRRFLTTLSLAGAASLLPPQRALAAEGALETTTVRLVNDRSICIAPEYVADELLGRKALPISAMSRHREASNTTRFCAASSILPTSSPPGVSS
jgi:hypothetical protein